MDDPKIRVERFDKALQYVDRLLPLIHDVAHFEPSEIVINSNWSEQDKNEAGMLFTYIEQTFKKLEYATGDGYWFELTDIGIAAKNAGGHFEMAQL